MNVDLAKSTSTSGTVVTVLSVVGSGSANSVSQILKAFFKDQLVESDNDN